MFTYVVKNSSRKPSSSSFCTTVYKNQPFFAPGKVFVHLQQFWNRGSTLYALLASDGVIACTATRSTNILVSHQFKGSGCQVLQDLLCLHHPGHQDSHAPGFEIVKGTVPIMPTSIIPREQLAELTKYFMGFSHWESHLRLYTKSKYMHETKYHVLFIDGLLPVLRNQVLTLRNATISWSSNKTIGLVSLKQLLL
jgi:hypothetical protein